LSFMTVVGFDAEHAGEADQALVVGEDADDVGAPANLAVKALERVRGSQLAPVAGRERVEREDVGLGVLEHGGDLAHPAVEMRDGFREPIAGLRLGVGVEDRADQGGQQPVLIAPRVAEAISEEYEQPRSPPTCRGRAIAIAWLQAWVTGGRRATQACC
jgi:hypothetical protein